MIDLNRITSTVRRHLAVNTLSADDIDILFVSSSDSSTQFFNSVCLPDHPLTQSIGGSLDKIMLMRFFKGMPCGRKSQESCIQNPTFARLSSLRGNACRSIRMRIVQFVHAFPVARLLSTATIKFMVYLVSVCFYDNNRFLRASHSRNRTDIRIPGYRPTHSCQIAIGISLICSPVW